MCTQPGCAPRLQRGDVVLVAYEDDDDGSPVVLGLLFQTKNTSVSDVNFGSASFNVDVSLPEDTSIGDVTKDNLINLQGLRDNAQKQFDEVRTSINDIDKRIDMIIETVNQTITEGVAKKVSYYGSTPPEKLSPGEEGQLYIYIED